MYKITYFTAVKKPCGYRQELVTAMAEKVSDKICKIVSASMEPASSKRQAFNTKFWADLEIGKNKRISTLKSFEIAE